MDTNEKLNHVKGIGTMREIALNSVQHYLGTVEDEERKIASVDAERMEAKHGDDWVFRFCDEYGIEVRYKED
jgi:hypothetical protein